MTKTQKLMLSDYLKDPSDVRLTIFSDSINPEFSMSAKNKEKLKVLITDYEKDSENKGRVKALELFLSGAAKVKTQKMGKIKLITDANRTEPLSLAEAQADAEIGFVIGSIGDWRVQGTYAYEILNGNQSVIRVNPKANQNNTVIDMKKILEWLGKHSGKTVRQFDVVNTVEEGQQKQSWVLTDRRSGLAAYNPRQTTYYKDGVVTAVKQGINF